MRSRFKQGNANRLARATFCPHPRPIGDTRVDIQHLLEDLRDAYSGSLEETVLTEIVASALDSGACWIDLAVDAPAASLTVVDNGYGMQRRELSR